MYRNINRLCAAIALAGVLLSTAGITARAIDRTIAKINDDIVTESDLAEIAADVSWQFNSRFVSAFDSATTETVMSMFDKQLLLQEARRMKITAPGDELNTEVESMVRDIRSNFSSEREFHQALAAEHISLDQLKQELIDKVKTDFLVFHVVNSRFSVSDEEVQQFQQQKSGDGETLESFRLRRLGIPVKEGTSPDVASREAQTLVARIITEGISFEEGIRKYSQVPGAALDGGDMGYMSTDKLSAQVKAAVENLQVGQASAPIVAGGFANVFYVEGKRGARSAIREEKFFEARDELLKSLRRRAILQVFDQRLLKLMPQEYMTVLKAAGQGPLPQDGVASTPTPAPAFTPAQNPQYPAATQPAYIQQTQPAPTPTPAPRRRWFGPRQ